MPADRDYIVFGRPFIGEEELREVQATLESGWIGTGPRVQAFAASFAKYVGACHAVPLSSGSAALHLALLASGIGPGDEVITTPLTFAATANAIVHTGATPVFVDVDRTTMNIDVDQVELAVTPYTRAIVPVHFAGRPCEMHALTRIASNHGLVVIEDAAHCIEGWYHGRKIGTISPLTCFSYYVTKNITTCEGGMVCTSDSELAGRIRMLGLHGLTADAWKRFSDAGHMHYEVLLPGFKYNMTDLSAALGLCQLQRIQQWLHRREEIWSRYDAAFEDLPCGRPAPPDPGTVHARHLYTLLIEPRPGGVDRDEFMRLLHRAGVGTGVHYRSLHLHSYYRERFGFNVNQFPNAYWTGERTVSLPLSARLTDGDVERVIAAVHDALLAKRSHREASSHGSNNRGSADRSDRYALRISAQAEGCDGGRRVGECQLANGGAGGLEPFTSRVRRGIRNGIRAARRIPWYPLWWCHGIWKRAKRLWLSLFDKPAVGIPRQGSKDLDCSASDSVDLSPGDWVRVRPGEQIQRTLRNGRCRGCAFAGPMFQYCGEKHRVFKRVDRFFDEARKRQVRCRGVVLLENVFCDGTGYPDSAGCDRSCFYFWRTEWLEPVEP